MCTVHVCACAWGRKCYRKIGREKLSASRTLKCVVRFERKNKLTAIVCVWPRMDEHNWIVPSATHVRWNTAKIREELQRFYNFFVFCIQTTELCTRFQLKLIAQHAKLKWKSPTIDVVLRIHARFRHPINRWVSNIRNKAEKRNETKQCDVNGEKTHVKKKVNNVCTVTVHTRH